MRGHAIFITIVIFYLHNTLSLQTATLQGTTVVETIDKNGYTQIGSKYYLIEREKNLNWFAAAHYCREKGLDLATIENQNEMFALSAHLLSEGYNTDDWFWLSGNDLESEGRFKWLSTGLPMAYTKWSPNQPDNWKGKEHCVELWRIDNQFLMNDRDCYQVSRLICEVPLPKKITYSVW